MTTAEKIKTLEMKRNILAYLQQGTTDPKECADLRKRITKIQDQIKRLEEKVLTREERAVLKKIEKRKLITGEGYETTSFKPR